MVALPLRPVTLPQAARSRELMMAAKEGLDVEFFELVRAYKTVVLAQFQNKNYELLKNTAASWGLSHQLSGCGNALPVEVHSICLGPDFALVFLPGEVFVELWGSPSNKRPPSNRRSSLNWPTQLKPLTYPLRQRLREEVMK